MRQNPHITHHNSNVLNNKFVYSAETLELDAESILADAAELNLLAKRFAPILNFHPLEEHDIVNVNWYLQKMHLVDEFNRSAININPNHFPPAQLNHQHCFLESKSKVKKTVEANKSLAITYVHAKQLPNNCIDLQYWFLFSGKGSSTANIKWLVEGITGHNSKLNLEPIACKDGHWERITIRIDCETFLPTQIFLSNAKGGKWFNPDKLEMNGGQPIIYVSKNNHFFYPSKGFKLIEFLKFKVLSSTIEFSFFDECSSGNELDASQSCQLLSSDGLNIDPRWLNYQGKWANPDLQNLDIEKVNKVLKEAFGKELAFLLGNNISDKLSSFLISYYANECKCKAYGPKRMKCWLGHEETS